jgi:hypothetical protein
MTSSTDIISANDVIDGHYFCHCRRLTFFLQGSQKTAVVVPRQKAFFSTGIMAQAFILPQH